MFRRSRGRGDADPPDMSAMMGLSVLSLALARKIRVEIRRGWIEPVNIWTITTMEPANRKSAVVRDVMAPVVEYQREEARRLAPAILEAQTRLKILGARIERMNQGAARARGDEERAHLTEAILTLTREANSIRVPATPRLWTDDCTPEMMASLLTEHQERMAILSAEGNVLELMAGRYSRGRPNLGIYLHAHAGDAYTVDRRGRPKEELSSPALTVGITVQKEVLRSMARQPGFRGMGLLARFLYCFPESRLGYRRSDPEPVPAWVFDHYRRHVTALLELPFRADHGEENAAHVIRLDDEAQLSTYGSLGSISDWAGKLCGAVGRIAGLLHSATMVPHHRPWEAPISAEVAQRAVHIGEYLVEHTKAAFAEMGNDPILEDARFILGWIRRNGARTFSERDLYQALKGGVRFKMVAALQQPLGILIDRGYPRPMPGREAPRRGRPFSLAYEVNPACLDRQPPHP